MCKRLFPFLVFLILAACQNEPGQPRYSGSLPDSNGGRLDVLVVAKESIWQDIAGETLRKFMADAQYGLPQSEPLFTLRQVEPHQFNSLLQRARNLILLDLDTSTFVAQKNVYAKPQLIYRFSAPTERELAELIVKKQEEVVHELRQSEVNYLQRRLTAQHHPGSPILQAHNVSMAIPMDYELENSGDNLLVYWKKGLKSDQGILIYFEPLDPDDAILGDRIIPLRDSLTQIYIQGEKEGSYMLVEDLISPAFTNRDFDGQYSIETRGLWRTAGDFMGGAFVNYTIFDERNNQRIMLDGFIYAPELNKRNLLLEMEAILQTLEITN